MEKNGINYLANFDTAYLYYTGVQPLGSGRGSAPAQTTSF